MALNILHFKYISHSLIKSYFAYLHVYFTLQYTKGHVNELKQDGNVVHIFCEEQVVRNARGVRNYTYMCMCLLLATEFKIQI